MFGLVQDVLNLTSFKKILIVGSNMDQIKGCMIGARRPRRRAHMTEVVTEPTGVMDGGFALEDRLLSG